MWGLRIRELAVKGRRHLPAVPVDIGWGAGSPLCTGGTGETCQNFAGFTNISKIGKTTCKNFVGCYNPTINQSNERDKGVTCRRQCGSFFVPPGTKACGPPQKGGAVRLFALAAARPCTTLTGWTATARATTATTPAASGSGLEIMIYVLTQRPWGWIIALRSSKRSLSSDSASKRPNNLWALRIERFPQGEHQGVYENGIVSVL